MSDKPETHDLQDDASINGKSTNLNTGDLMLTPLHWILINKKMPKGFKIETEENVIKAAEALKPAIKKQKISHRELLPGEESKRKRAKKIDYSDIASKDNSEFSGTKKRSLREKKPIVHEDLGYIEKDKLKGPKNPLLADITKKCEKGFQKIKKHPLAEYFMNPVAPDAPSLSLIEKNIKSYVYTSVYQFGLDLRKLWTYHFSTYTGNGEIFQRTCKLSEYSEEVLKELESLPEEKSDIHELSKKVEKLTKEVKEISHKGGQPPQLGGVTKKEKGGSILDKPLSNAEKNTLGNAIRNLTPDQLKGIVNILSDSLVIDPQSRFFEFDIETLSTRKLRELERYVKQCLKNNRPPAKQVEVKPPRKTLPSTGELTESERVAKLKNDLAFKGIASIPQPSQPAQVPLQNITQSTTVTNNIKRPPIPEPKEAKDNKHIFSDSDESLSSSEESESESLSSLDFKKGMVGNK